MLNDDVNRISLSGESYAIKCSLLVLEKIQDKYGDVGAFEDKIIVFERSDEDEKKIKVRYPDPEAVCDALFWFCQEGETIEAEKRGGKPKELTRDGLARKVDTTIFDIATELHREFMNCFRTKKENPTKITAKKEHPQK